jgi:hypothetical protein
MAVQADGCQTVESLAMSDVEEMALPKSHLDCILVWSKFWLKLFNISIVANNTYSLVDYMSKKSIL